MTGKIKVLFICHGSRQKKHLSTASLLLFLTLLSIMILAGCTGRTGAEEPAEEKGFQHETPGEAAASPTELFWSMPREEIYCRDGVQVQLTGRVFHYEDPDYAEYGMESVTLIELLVSNQSARMICVNGVVRRINGCALPFNMEAYPDGTAGSVKKTLSGAGYLGNQLYAGDAGSGETPLFRCYGGEYGCLSVEKGTSMYLYVSYFDRDAKELFGIETPGSVSMDLIIENTDRTSFTFNTSEGETEGKNRETGGKLLFEKDGLKVRRAYADWAEESADRKEKKYLFYLENDSTEDIFYRWCGDTSEEEGELYAQPFELCNSRSYNFTEPLYRIPADSVEMLIALREQDPADPEGEIPLFLKVTVMDGTSEKPLFDEKLSLEP